MTPTERFARLFEGYSRAYGSYEIMREDDSGKKQGRARTHEGPLPMATLAAHLDGSGAGIGIIMLRDDDTCSWGVIDVDKYNIDLVAVEAAVRKRNLPLIPIRSKSGGCHLILFLQEPIEATKVQKTLATIAARLGLGGCEIFPKQTSRAREKDGSTKDIGNWINLPYYNAAMTLRYAIKDGAALDLEGFLDHAEASRIDRDHFNSLIGQGKAATSQGEPLDLFGDGPPCLEHLAADGGFAPGTRNEGLYNVGVYLKKKFPDGWEDELLAYNQKMCSPPLGMRELQDLMKSLRRKDYSYRCKQAPIAQHCNRRACLGRDHGVGGQVDQGGGDFLIGSITKYLSDPVLWGIEIDGRRIMVDTPTLLSHSAFSRHCADALNRVPSPVPGARWARYIDELLRSCEEVPVPEEASLFGQFKLFVNAWLNGRTQARSIDEVLLDKPWKEGGRVYFQSSALKKRLDVERFDYRSMHHVWDMLRQMGGSTEGRHLKIGYRNLWHVPDPGHKDEAPSSPAAPKSDAETF